MMSAVMQRIQSRTGLSQPWYAESDSLRWSFREELLEKEPAFFSPLIKKHSLLTFEYNALCTQIVHHYHQEQPNWDHLTEQVIAALLLAQLLAYIYRHHLNIQAECLRLQREEEIYKEFLKQQGFYFTANFVQKPKKLKIPVRQWTAFSNWPRLFTLRTRRVLTALVPLTSNLQSFCHIVRLMEKYSNPLVAYASWLFFIPRLLNNLFFMSIHLLPGPWMDDKEKEQSLGTRFIGQAERRWFEIVNDSVWLLAGLLNCFVFLGPLAIPSLYFNVIFYAIDVASAVFRAGLEISRLTELSRQYKNMENREDDPARLLEIKSYQASLQKYIRLETASLILRIANTSALVLAVLITLPALAAATPLLPAMGAVASLSVTFLTWLGIKIIEKQRPSTQVDCILQPKASSSPHTFFQKMKEEVASNPAVPSFNPLFASSS